ncbi:MAG: hypothetical protein IPK83_17075 [Planctomycetes bacterium]|nr:hypothetical protein [Planctomycetota bacterium]
MATTPTPVWCITQPDGNISRYVYEVNQNPAADRHVRGNLRRVQHERNTYPVIGDQNTIVRTFDYQSGMGGCCGTNFVTREVDALGHETHHDYDSNGNRNQTIHRIPSIVENWEYNTFGQMTAHILPANGSGHRRRDEYRYYESGPMMGYLQQEIIDADGFALTTTYEYDTVGNVTRVIDARGSDTLYTYNSLNQVVRELSRETGGPLRAADLVRRRQQPGARRCRESRRHGCAGRRQHSFYHAHRIRHPEQRHPHLSGKGCCPASVRCA